MKRLACVLALSTLALSSATAFAEKEFNAKGTVELGGSLGFESGDGATIVSVKPQIGYFLASSFELISRLRVDYKKPGLINPDGETSVGLDAGAGYFIPVAGVYLGPQALLGFGRDGASEKNAFLAEAMLALKVPFGNSALIFVGAGYRYTKVFDVGSRSTIAGDIGFSLFF